MIEITGLEKKYGTDFSLRIDSLRFEPGDRVALIGTNGSGKTTLLRLLAGRIKPDSGNIHCDIPRKEIGYQPQTPYAFRGSAAYNISLAAKSDADIKRIIKDCALESLAKKKMTALSGGERQRVFLARMLAGPYSLLLLDEPLSAADIQTGNKMAELLRAHCEQNGVTLVFSTHLPTQAFQIATKIVLLDHGAVAECGAADRMRNPKSEFGKLFFSQWIL